MNQQNDKAMRMGLTLLAMTVLVLSGRPLFADDGEAEIAASGIEFKKSETISMEQEKLFISEKLVRVKFGFKNQGKKDYRTLVAFPMPTYVPYPQEACEIGMNTECSRAERIERSARSFTVRSNGRKIVPKLEIKAIVKTVEGETDVAPLLKKHSVPLDSEDEALLAINKLSPAARQELYKAGVTGPNWTIKKTFYWEQVFKAGAMTVLEHEYQPIAGYGQGPDSEDFISTYCIDKSTLKAMKLLRARNAKKNPDQASLYGSTVHYILTSANTWVGPIRDFELTIEKPTAASLVSLCMDKIQKTGPKTFRVRLKNFTPSKELKVLFVGK